MRNSWSQSRLLSGIFLLMLAAMAACSREQGAPRQYLYATLPETGLIVVYPVSASGTAQPLAIIRENPPDKPIDVSVDLSGEVFVANENGNIRAYSGRNFHYELIHTLEGPHTRIQHPTAIVVNIDGTFYFADAGSAEDRPRIEWFSAGQNGNVFPNRVITGPHTGITSPRGLALDGSGRLFVSDQSTNKVLVFKPDASGDAAPVVALSGLNSPGPLFVDQLLNIYVCNRGDSSVAVFMTTGPQSWSRNGAAIRSTRMRQLGGVAVDQSGRIAVATNGGIWFFPANSDGQIEPAAELQGRSPVNPAGIFIQ
jgi:hypothetical protein